MLALSQPSKFPHPPLMLLFVGLLSTDESNIKVFKFGCPLHFANVELFTDFISDYFRSVGSIPIKVDVIGDMKEAENSTGAFSNTLVLDGGAIAYLDSMAIEALQTAFTDGKRVNVNVLYADFSGKFGYNLV